MYAVDVRSTISRSLFKQKFSCVCRPKKEPEKGNSLPPAQLQANRLILIDHRNSYRIIHSDFYAYLVNLGSARGKHAHIVGIAGVSG